MLFGWQYSDEYRYFNALQKALPEKSNKRLCRKVFPKLEIHRTNQIRKITFVPPFFMLETITNFNTLVNLGCCESDGGVTKTDTSDEMRMGGWVQ